MRGLPFRPFCRGRVAGLPVAGKIKKTFAEAKVSVVSDLVGETGFEPATSNSRSWRANRTALHPELCFFGALIVLRAHKDKPKIRKHQIFSEKNIISPLSGRYLRRCRPSRHHFAELPIQVHLCQIHSSGPCLCRLSHHLQQAICSTSIAMPMSRLTVCPQRVASPSPNG